ncbi:MAG: glycosyltransferase family 4 protein [Acidobacteriaceae bacterium]|nr:glycosyltransferase family 4 protein [Acidobacteriaceae bacterium]
MAYRRLKRILLTGDTVGGVWTFTLELAEGLIRRGLEVCLATFGPSAADFQIRSARAMTGLTWIHHSSKLEWMEAPWPDIKRAGQWLTGVALTERPDLIHMNTLCHGDLPWKIPVVTTVHSCVASWWAAVKQSPLPPEWRHYQQVVESSLKSATIITAPSHVALAAIGKHYAIEIESGFAIYNGRRPGGFRIQEKKPLILSVGRLWDEAKNAKILAGLAPQLSWPVFLAGDPRSPNGDETVLPGCRLLGHLSPVELSEWYARAAIYVSPARYEPFGLSVLEAAMSGCALVLGDIASLREIWQDAAAFVAPNDADALKTVLQRLMHDSIYRAKMSRRALSRASEFTESRMVTEYLCAYQSALAKHGRHTRRHACAS